jgi:hypothetical protein
MAIPLTVKQYLIKQKLAEELEGDGGQEMLIAICEGLNIPVPEETFDDEGKPNGEYAAWVDAFGRVQRKLLG